MLPAVDTLQWMPTGRWGLQAMREAILGARKSVRLQMYIFRPNPPGTDYQAALTAAARNGVSVRVQLDALGSRELPDAFWAEFRAAGGEVRQFNTFGSGRYLTRDHRKLCVVDDSIAFVMGFNISPEYDGDGITSGWMDVGVAIQGPAVTALAELFDRQYGQSDSRPVLWARFQKRRERVPATGPSTLQVLPVSPGRQASCLLKSLYTDIPRAKRLWLCSPYYLPTAKLRRLLARAARRGADVRVILPAHSDVPITQFAARRLYAAMFRAGIKIFEFQPQILHAKVLLIDQATYVGSSNLDQRSLHLNHELMIRSTDETLRIAVEKTFDELMAHSRPVPRDTWATSRTWLMKLRERWAFFALYRLDPWLTYIFTKTGT